MLKLFFIEGLRIYILISMILHVLVGIFILLIGFVNFNNQIILMSSHDKPVFIRLGQIRNTRMKESDNKTNQKNTESVNNQKTLKKSIKFKSESPKSVETYATKPTNLHHKNRLEMKKKQEKSLSKTAKQNTATEQPQIPSRPKENKRKHKKSPFDFGMTEDLRECKSFEECKTIEEVHQLQLKNDILAFIAEHWSFPDSLLNKDICLETIITFDNSGYITQYTISPHPKTENHKLLKKSIEQFFALIKHKPLPLNGKKVKCNTLKFTFFPLRN